MTCRPPSNEAMLLYWWTSARQSTPKTMHKGLDSTALRTPRMTWKHGNNCIFNQAQLSVNTLVERMKEGGCPLL
jgi:hypothetical protein